MGVRKPSGIVTPLILAYAKQTLNLKPKKKYVPWVTVNSMPLYDNYDDFVVQVCKAYKGRSPLPKFCSSASAKKKVLTLQVSYADEAFHY
ncbi:hypothetical protein F2Q68_00021320 [Brassica cretica]|uniref:Uncharacterized protein n=2 Tax=Brassica cretica TaxID=69181 RepID=A0ABQ7CYI5_BRACR|nr:hypothetical protein F2Q68_00021320 [Brassica cretica]KAF3565137.1 hypothetical protein DY000_02016499 [Brassica cretica]